MLAATNTGVIATVNALLEAIRRQAKPILPIPHWARRFERPNEKSVRRNFGNEVA
jgi:hypothetical protein